MAKYIVLNTNFEVESILDQYESIIWTQRAREIGDFELYTLATKELLNKLQVGYYVMTDTFYDETADEAQLMIIEDLEIKNDAENGDKLIVTGRDLKSLLDRRIVWKQTKIDKNTSVQTAIVTLLNDAIISPTDTKRTISNFVYDTDSGTFPTIKKEIQYVGESIYDCVNDLCEKYHLNYEIVLRFTDKKFHMRIVRPVDHGWDQTDNPPVIFSSKFNNLRNSSYKELTSPLKNVALVHGEGDEYNSIKTDIGSNDYEGLARRETFVNCSDMSQELEDGTIYSDATYTNMIKEKAQKELNKINKDNKVYEGEADNVRSYKYGVDYTVGDIVELVNEYELDNKVYVKEMVLSESTSGITLIPTFKSLREEEDEEES